MLRSGLPELLLKAACLMVVYPTQFSGVECVWIRQPIPVNAP